MIIFPDTITSDFWLKARMAKNRLLALDYDGTLANFKIDRTKAYPFEGIVDKLIKIRNSKTTTLAIVSGRPVRDVLDLMGDIKIIIIGCHGSEFYYPEKSDTIYIPDEKQEKRLRQAKQEKRLTQAKQEAIIVGGDSIMNHLERKSVSLAFHTRGMPPEEARRIEKEILRLWTKNSTEVGLECRHFNSGLELRPVDINKGIVIRKLIEEQPENVFSVYIGDDETDEDAFEVIKKIGGIGFKVGNPDQKTKATGYIKTIKDVYKFLEKWADVII